MSTDARALPEWTDALARPRLPARQQRDDEREFAPALRAIARAKKLAPQLQLLGRVHTLLGAAALSAALGASVVLGGAVLFASPVPQWALAVGGALVAALGLLGLPWLALGFGLRRRRAWARTLGFVCSAVLLPFAPLGTALAAWTLVVLLGWNPALARAAGAD
ncbi:MAG TPA: hypothetical protein VII78_17210 [Myxococcota bacterium]|jgi:hypothetical protein